MTPDFDRIARPYRWLEYATLGPLLERTRYHFLAHLLDRRRALILGDGDGRFTARLLAANPTLEADAVDLSGAMLGLLTRRVAAARTRLRTHRGDALSFTPEESPDLIVTHFFLDCLGQPEVDALVLRLAHDAVPGAVWLVSEFRIPDGPLRLPARFFIRSLYAAFRILTGLRTSRLPDHATPLGASGFRLVAEHRRLFGLLSSQLWQLDERAAEVEA